MQADQNTQGTSPDNTPVSAPVADKSPLWKELSVPISIMVAGVFIGAGLYFGNMHAGTAMPAVDAVAQAEAEPEDKTSLVDPVTAEDHIRGSLDAPIKIVEFSDYSCGFCARFHETMKNIVEKYDGDVAWVYRQFPVLGQQSQAVAVASECVAELRGNEAFWQFTDGYFDVRLSGGAAGEALVTELYREAGISDEEFIACFEGGSTLAGIRADVEDASETGGGGTPWSILIAPDGTTYPINGAIPQGAIEQLIDSVLAEA